MIDWSKPICTISGHKARVICKDFDSGMFSFNNKPTSYIVLVANGFDKNEIICYLDEDGISYEVKKPFVKNQGAVDWDEPVWIFGYPTRLICKDYLYEPNPRFKYLLLTKQPNCQYEVPVVCDDLGNILAKEIEPRWAGAAGAVSNKKPA